MRTTTLPSMLEILTRNYNYRNKSARLYELGRVYLPGGGATAWRWRKKVLSLGAYGEGHGLLCHEGGPWRPSWEIRAADVTFEAPTDPQSLPTTPAAVPTCWQRPGVGVLVRSTPWWPRTTAWTPSSTAPSWTLTS